jgi:glutamate--cysteine ligase catalytic subunit
MGLLTLGTPLKWDQAKTHIRNVKESGISQLINTYHTYKTRTLDAMTWGDELEYVCISILNNKVELIDATQTLEKLQNLENVDSLWHPEYARYMLEGTPRVPYSHHLSELTKVMDNMVLRRSLAASMLPPNCHLMSIANYFWLGVGDFCSHSPTPDSGSSCSLFLPDHIIAKHVRFRTLTANIRCRRESKVQINVPIFKDSLTPSPFKEPLSESLKQFLESNNIPVPPSLPDYTPFALPDHIYMDAMGFGMGCCCLQVTFQACSVEQARLLYDQLTVVAPIMLALSAACPIFRGYLSNVDCRWDVISASVDDRNPQERGLVVICVNLAPHWIQCAH